MPTQKRLTKRTRRKIVYKDNPPVVVFIGGGDGERFFPIDKRFNSDTLRRLALIGLARYLSSYSDMEAAYERLAREGIYALKFPLVGGLPTKATRIQAIADMYGTTAGVIRGKLARMSKSERDGILNREDVIKAARLLDERRSRGEYT